MQTERPTEGEGLRLLNLSNLFSLWESVAKAHGTLEVHRGFKKIYKHGTSWPNRIWLTGDDRAERTQATLRDAHSHLTQKSKPIILTLSEKQAEISSDWREAEGLSLVFTQTGMVLDLETASDRPTEGDLEVLAVNAPHEAALWSRCASEAFGYSVDPVVVQSALSIPEITFYLGTLSEEVVGTGLLCTHQGVAGLHMAGTRPPYRRKGVARQMMHHLIREARARGFGHGTLQASAMGEPLYIQLGFSKQFTLHNYLFSGR